MKFYRVLPLKTRKKLFEKHRNLGGKLGLGLRYALLKSIAKKCGDNVSIYQNVFVSNPESLTIGDNVSIQPMTYIECGVDKTLGLIIKNDVSIAHGVTVMSTSHTYKRHDLPIKDQEVETRQTMICSDVWIGAKATILAGITVASGCVIGANAVVTKDTETNKVFVGVPARAIKER
ncbi:MAG: acyltransferase [Acinetobacter sp.]